MGLYAKCNGGKESYLVEIQRERECVCERERGRAYEKEGSSVGTKITRFP